MFDVWVYAVNGTLDPRRCGTIFSRIRGWATHEMVAFCLRRRFCCEVYLHTLTPLVQCSSVAWLGMEGSVVDLVFGGVDVWWFGRWWFDGWCLVQDVWCFNGWHVCSVVDGSLEYPNVRSKWFPAREVCDFTDWWLDGMVVDDVILMVGYLMVWWLGVGGFGVW